MANIETADLEKVLNNAIANDALWASKVHAYRANQEVKPLGIAGIKPILSFNAQTSRDSFESNNFGNDDYTSTNYGATLIQPLFRLERWREYQKSSALDKQADSSFLYERQSFYIRVVETFFGVLRAEENLKYRDAEKSAINSQLKQTKHRFSAGLAANTDLQEAQAAFDVITVQHIIAKQELELALEELHTLTNVDYTTVNPLKDDIPITPPSPGNVKEWIALALQNNPEIKSIRYAKDAAHRSYQAKTAAHLPTLDLVASYRDTDRYIQTSEGELQSDSISLKLEVPLYSGGAISASRRQAKELYLQAASEHHFKKREVLQRTRNFYRYVLTDISRVKAQRQSIYSVESALSAIEAGYKTGTRTMVDLLNAQNSLYAAKREYANARFDYITNSLKLKRIVGILEKDDLINVNKWLDSMNRSKH